MTTKPFGTIPAIMLSLPGVLLLVGALVSLSLFYKGEFESRNHLVSDLTMFILGAGALLAPVTLITASIAIFYSLRRSGSSTVRIGFVVLNVLMLLVSLACAAGVLVGVMVVFANPG